MKKRMLWGLMLIAAMLGLAALLAHLGDAWGQQYCNAPKTFCITPLQQHTQQSTGIMTTLYSGNDFRPFMRPFNGSRLTLLDAKGVVFDQDADQIVVYSNGSPQPLDRNRLKDWKVVHSVHIDGDPCAFITTLKYNFTPAARCWRGQFHE